MYPIQITGNKIVAALLTVALASSQPTSPPEEILSRYRKFLSQLSRKTLEPPLKPAKEGRKFRV